MKLRYRQLAIGTPDLRWPSTPYRRHQGTTGSEGQHVWSQGGHFNVSGQSVWKLAVTQKHRNTHANMDRKTLKNESCRQCPHFAYHLWCKAKMAHLFPRFKVMAFRARSPSSISNGGGGACPDPTEETHGVIDSTRCRGHYSCPCQKGCYQDFQLWIKHKQS